MRRSKNYFLPMDARQSNSLAPRIQLAKEAGITTNRGIVVNRQLKTNLQNIYSLGDCAEVEGHVLPYVMPIMQAARTFMCCCDCNDIGESLKSSRMTACNILSSLSKSPSCFG
ncbi:MAG: hypothetical protein EBY99_03240 [Burkholderiaceae bacterium]|nr:hypothetical protein [Burkholderiaceae bacterium]